MGFEALRRGKNIEVGIRFRPIGNTATLIAPKNKAGQPLKSRVEALDIPGSNTPYLLPPRSSACWRYSAHWFRRTLLKRNPTFFSSSAITSFR
jgi:hypothetical protein